MNYFVMVQPANGRPLLPILDAQGTMLFFSNYFEAEKAALEEIPTVNFTVPWFLIREMGPDVNTFLPEGSGPCAKRVVNAVLVLPNGNRYASTNFCMKPQISCPRNAAGYAAGEGYHLCQDVCDQPAHAEVNVLQYAQFYEEHLGLKGTNYPLIRSDLYVDHTWVCDGCRSAAHHSGCLLHEGKVPGEVKTK